MSDDVKRGLAAQLRRMEAAFVEIRQEIETLLRASEDRAGLLRRVLKDPGERLLTETSARFAVPEATGYVGVTEEVYTRWET